MDAPLCLSVILAVRGEQGGLGETLACLAAQDFEGSWEIVLALADEDPGEAEVIASFRRDHPERELRVVANPEKTTPRGLNRALAVARGASIARIDGHCLPPPHYLRSVVEGLEASGAECVGGAMGLRPRGPVGCAFAALSGVVTGAGGAAFRNPSEVARPVDSVYLGAWPRRSFVRFGGFDEGLIRNQDDELALRIRSGKGRVLLLPDLRCENRPRESHGALFRQHFGYGYFKPRVLFRHPRGVRIRHLAVALLVPALLLFPLEVGGGYLVLLLLQALVLRRRHPKIGIPLLISCAATLHLAYGLGFWAGLPRMAARRRIPWIHGREDESERLVEHFRQRDRGQNEERAFTRYLAQTRRRSLRRLWPGPTPLAELRVLEIGCGNGGWLELLRDEGVPEERLHGIDLVPERIERARERLPGAELKVGDGGRLPYPEGSFDLVILATVLSSVRLREAREALVEEARRVSKGALLVHDLRRVRPGSAMVPIDALEERALFGERSRRVISCVLLPPIARPLSRLSIGLCKLLERIPGMRGHFTLIEDRRG